MKISSGDKSGGSKVEMGGAEKAANVIVPKGYLTNADGTITGPRGGTYSPTGAFDGGGNPVFIDGTGNYYKMTPSGAARVVSPNPSSNIGVTGQIGENALKSLAVSHKHHSKPVKGCVLSINSLQTVLRMNQR